MTRRRAIAIGALLLFGACGDEKKFTLVVSVISDDGKPIADVPVKLGDGTRGVTDEGGQLRRRVIGEEGQRFTVAVDPPKGYGFVGTPKPAVVLRHLVDLEGGSGKSLPIEFSVKLAPSTRTYAVLVRSNAPGLPVEAFGDAKATTNSKGVAMFLYTGTPGEALTVKLDTSALPRLQPQNPPMTFQLGSKQQAFVFRQTFTQLPEKRAPKIRHIIRHL